MKKYMIQSWNPLPATSIYEIEKKLKQVGTIEEKRIIGDYGCCFILTTDDSHGINAKTIKNTLLEPIADVLHSRIMIAKLDETEYEETTCLNEDPIPCYYCFSRFHGSYKDALCKFANIKPRFQMPDKTERDMTFAEYLLCDYYDFNKDKVSYERYLKRFLNLCQ